MRPRPSIGLLLLIAALSLATTAVTHAQSPVANPPGRSDAGGAGSVLYAFLPEALDGNSGKPAPGSPDLVVGSLGWSAGGVAIVPGSPWTVAFQARPIWSATNEHADSFYLNGPTGWTIASIGSAPANNRGNGIAVNQAFQQPLTGGNTSSQAHSYWGFQQTGTTAFSYVNAPTITPPARTWSLDTPWGVYTGAASPGGAQVDFVTTYNVPSSWATYLCPGALAPHHWIGLSGVDTNPNYMVGSLRSSDCSSTTCPVDTGIVPIRACRPPAVSVAKTGAVTGITGLPGQAGTVKVKYCFTVTNSSTNVHLANYVVTDATIGYNSGAQAVALAPGASAPQICAPDFTFNVTWPTSGSVCVTNTSGASVTANTPSGWGEITPNNPADGFTTRTFSASQTGANAGLQTCASPLAITLAEFYAQQAGDHVLVTWETASELGNRGFNLYRGTSPAGWDRQLNPALIPSQGQGSPSGFVYTWEDRADLVPGVTYYYWLQDLDVYGATTMHGPVSVDFVVPTAVTLGGVDASPVAGAAALPWLAVVAGAGVALALGRRR